MIKAEIKKNDTLYVLDLTQLGDINKAYAFALGVATNTENYNDGVQIVDLGTSKEYDHIRVYVEEQQGVQVAEPAPAATENLPEEYITSFKDRITYLGQDLQLKGIKAVADGVPFVLIYEINDQPAYEMATHNALCKITDYQGQVLGYANPVAIVPPADLLTEEDALEYVEDYIKDIKKAAADLPGEKTATAFVNFNKDEE